MVSVDSLVSISVVITCYKEGELLRDAVDSVLPQSPQEIIIVNDASPHQRTNEICRELELNSKISVIWQQQNGGPSIARNHGFERAQSDVLVPLDADDLLPENALNHLAQTFRESPEVGFAYGTYLRQDEPNQPARRVIPQDISLATMLSAKQFSLSSRWQLLGTTPIRKSVWRTVGKYDPAFGARDLHDVEFWIRVLNSGCQYVAIDQPIYIWRKYLGSNSRQVSPMSWYQIAKKYFKVYQAIGLDYRAYELLLIGSQWKNDVDEVRIFRKKLWQCIKKGHYRFSSLMAITLPTLLFQLLAQRAGKNR